jgi:iron complex outermembrane receptor protein
MIKRLLITLLCAYGSSSSLWSQTITGTIIDNENQPLIGASVRVAETTIGTAADLDGKFSLKVSPGRIILEFSFTGFEPQTRTVTVADGETRRLNIQLRPKENLLNEVVVIGYGTQEKKDLTGSIVSLSSKDFLEGSINTPDQLVMGKVAGVQITPNGGNPGAGSTIRIRGGSSLNASNDPLIVIDGVPVANDGIAGSPNPLSLINPNDIENITVLKDASATAIYGSRASNGVIIVTTKKAKAGGRFRVEFNTVNSVSTVAKYADILTADQMRTLIQEKAPASANLMGTANTDWQREIYRPAFSSDNLFTFSGGVKNLPYRISAGFLEQNGILIMDNMKRGTINLNLSPTFFNDHLKVEINQKTTNSRHFFADQGAVGSAVIFDPTQPVSVDSDRYGGFFEWESGPIPNNLAVRNPVGLVRQREDMSNVMRNLGNAQFDYKFHFLPELRANLNLGYDISRGTGSVRVADSAAATYSLQNTGLFSEYEQYRRNQLLEFYLGYKKEFESLKSVIDVVAGYSYQDWYFESPNIRTLDGQGDTIVGTQAPTFPLAQAQNTLISFYGRINYTFNQKYLFTYTLRNDGSSRFGPDQRWGLFPSAAFAWRIGEEKLFKNFKKMSDFKMRLGYGVTGQQDVGSNFNFLALYQQGEPSASYQFGNQWFYTLRPNVYDPNFRWESTTTWNAGFDIGFYDGRITAAIDAYYRKTTDLIAEINIPAGINFGTRVLTNVGEIENQGIEIMVNTVPIVNKNFEWQLGFNLTANRNTILKLDRFPDPSDLGNEVGGIGGSIGDFIQINTVGQQINSFFVYEQQYDANGMPIEVGAVGPGGTPYTLLDAFVDRNGDGVINDQDRYHYNNPIPRALIGINSGISYKRFTASFSGRLSLGNYVYNNFASNTGNIQHFASAIGTINNGSASVLQTGFNNKTGESIKSDYWIENASFFRMDNINFGYNFGGVFKDKANLRVFATIQNLFIITNYSGIDPEVFSGIDNNIYPRPRTFSIGANIQL